jgi:broad specificity phosphatase PhoE
VLLVRHAETAAPDRFHGAESDVGLSDRGMRQAELLAQSLKDTGAGAIYCSALRRALETANAIGRACKLNPTPIVSLHERRIGSLSGLSRDEGWTIYAESKQHWVAGDLEHSHPGGESYADIRRRVIPIFRDLAARHQGETIVVVAHGVVIRVVLTSLLSGAHPAEFDQFAIDFASLNDLWFDGASWTARGLNRVVEPSLSPPVA